MKFSRIAEILRESGAVAFGFAKAEPVEKKAWNIFQQWLNSGRHAGMGYMENHQEIRRDPRLLLPDAKTVISLAFSFIPEKFRDRDKGMIACYAYGDDYHDVLRKRLMTTTTLLKSLYGGEYRICIDSAPIMERYWAVKAGIGTIGENGAVIVPGAGSMIFLAEIITTLSFEADEPAPQYDIIHDKKKGGGLDECLNCGICVAACPGKAIKADRTVDSRRCLSYLTIEHKGEWTEKEAVRTIRTPEGENTIFGCDICLRSCPLNHDKSPTLIKEFYPREDIFHLDKKEAIRLNQEEFSRLFKGSPIKRCKLKGLKRNLGIKIE